MKYDIIKSWQCASFSSVQNSWLCLEFKAVKPIRKEKNMKIYDITQEVFGCVVFGKDPGPEYTRLAQISEGDLYDLTSFSMCAHNGTHIDAPAHFIGGGATIDQLSLDSTVGEAFVARHEGDVTADDAREILKKANAISPEAAKRILVAGKATLTLEGAKVFSESGILLFGNQSQTVGPEGSPRAVHLELLGAGVVLLEGAKLDEIPEGVYLLSASPLLLGGIEGAPCRAILIEK